MGYVRARKRVLFSIFVSDVTNFDHLLRRTSAVVFGPVCVQLLLSKVSASWTPMDLGLCVTEEHLHSVIGYLEKEGYIVSSPGDAQRSYSPRSVVKDIVFLERADQNINIVISNRPASIIPVFQLHSTLVMNYLTADIFFCAYPCLTAKFRGLVNGLCMRDGRFVLSGIVELIAYERRGFHLATNTRSWNVNDKTWGKQGCEKNLYCPSNFRASQDAGCLYVRLDSSGRVPHVDEDIDRPLIMWTLGWETCGGMHEAAESQLYVL
ncbi:hypothetical protein BJ138DRAFT_1015808 [Hygrophoropsis aurantiaca]|uniref:Uncharacterized protein n=1 Tax=Hygrophoropsis aurantiaca TaxID=72124 RepID=A0ACB8A126_9AGAM|nr:hypothetical protein BJ138DRAFT_1015808 [Hygrophoropsis aurantiaca]